VDGGDTGLAKRGNGMFISVYSGSSSVEVSEPGLRQRPGALDSWVGVVWVGDSGDIVWS
jgi:hypothetical protein